MNKIFKILLITVLTVLLSGPIGGCGLHNVKTESPVAPIEKEIYSSVPSSGWNKAFPDFSKNEDLSDEAKALLKGYFYYAYFTKTGLEIAYVIPPMKGFTVEWGWGVRMQTDLNEGWVRGDVSTKEEAFAWANIYIKMLMVSNLNKIDNG